MSQAHKPDGWFSLPRQGDRYAVGAVSPNTVDLLLEAGYLYLGNGRISRLCAKRSAAVHRARPACGETPIPFRRKEPFDDLDWLFDFKYDGFRALCYLEERRNRLISRNNNIMTRFDALAGQVATALDIDDAVLDGEVIVADETGRPVFIDLVRGTRSPCYVAFDLLWLNGTDLRPLPLRERRWALQDILPKGSPIVSEALSVEGRGRVRIDLCERSRGDRRQAPRRPV